MVGSVLLQRMIAEDDLAGLDMTFFSTSQVGHPGPDIGREIALVHDANQLAALAVMDIIISCQGGVYTSDIFPRLQATGWNGYWIDAASTMRLDDDAAIVLDPVNREVIDEALHAGTRKYIGGNCTVSLMLMALAGLFKRDLVEWLVCMTYQAASGAGAAYMRELVAQMRAIGQGSATLLDEPTTSPLELDKVVLETMHDEVFPVTQTVAPLAGSLLAWVDSDLGTGQSREEWKGGVETNKILNTTRYVPVDGICVRIGSMRCHSQALTIKLREDLPLEKITQHIADGNQWVNVVPNTRDETLRQLTPAAVTGTLTIPVGRLRKLDSEKGLVTAFTVGDQLLWGAAEPLRRILCIIKEYLLSK